MNETVRKSRLSRSAEFDRVYRQGRSAQHRLIVIYRFDRPEDISPLGDFSCRIGITVSKKIGNSVERNRLKRQLKDIFRQLDNLNKSSDYVAIARPGLLELTNKDFNQVKTVIEELVEKLAPKNSVK